MTSKRFTRLAFILSSAAIISYSAAAHAGFEWKGPLEAPAPQADAPADMSGMGDLAPVGAEPAPAPAAAMTPAPVAEAPAPAPAPVAAAAASAPAGGDVLAGFAKDVPLVMALQQIVPPGYQYSFASGVDAGTSVSWEGGKPWQAVLSDMLAAHALGFSVQNNTVVVTPSQNAMPVQQGAAAPMTETAAAAPAAPAPAATPDAIMSPMPGEPAPAAMNQTAANSNAPMNIVSQPPAMDNNMPGPAPAAVASSDMSAPAAAPAPAPQETAAAAPKKEETVTIHREKHKSLLERLGFVHTKKSDTVAADATPAPEKVAAADVPAPKPAATPVMSDAAPATAQPAAATTAIPANTDWHGNKGETLRDVLKAWSDKAGVQLYWSIDYDYRLSDDVGFAGSYDEAVGHLLDKFASIRPQPYGQLHQGGSGPRVLVIKSYDLAQ